MKHIKDDASIVLCGEAGMGIQTIEDVLTRILKSEGYNLFATKEVMSRIRGGSNSTEIRVASKKVAAYVDKIDVLIPLDKDAIPHLEKRITSETLIIGEQESLKTAHEIVDIPFSKIAEETGKKLYSNTVAAGVVFGLFEGEPEKLDTYLRKRFASKDTRIIEENIRAGRKGYEIGLEMRKQDKIRIEIERDPGVREDLLLNGAEAVAFGALAGGCNFVSSYPMSPSTPVMTYLAQQSGEFDIIVEQAEDEIAAINMGLGAWYAGGRAMVSTSGGGFALMCEGISLAGMIETPIVVHLAQRPGPATGLPTRTEQGDLNLALYTGHGEFPRIIFAPGTLREAFELTQKAFNFADKFQVPVLVLTDQFLIDSYYNETLDLSELAIEKHVVKTQKSYKRFALTETGISPRGIPGEGEGLVSVDSDEHTEEGFITENMDVRTSMVDKRLRKFDALQNEIIPPTLEGKTSYSILVVCWGSNYNVVKEAIDLVRREDIAMLHFSQVFPLHPDTQGYLERAEKTVIVENNATAQFGSLLKLYTGIELQSRILKYNGLPFSVEEIRDRLEALTTDA